MKSLAAEIFNSTIGKIDSLSISDYQDESTSINIKLLRDADTVSFVQGICLKTTNQEGEIILEAGIATLLKRANLSISKKIIETEKSGILIVPFSAESGVAKSSRVKLYFAMNGRILSREYAL
ncbi:MAG: hypothetical protein WCI36_02240 [bacterium]